MKLIRPSISHPIPNFLPKPRNLCNSPQKISIEDSERDEGFVTILKELVRGKQSWKISFNNSFITQRLKPLHVERVLIQTLDDPRLALRFFNFLGLHRNLHHSNLSFCILVHILVKCKLFWPADSVLQSFLLRGLNPRDVFYSFLKGYVQCGFGSSLGFDFLVQSYVQNKRVLDGVVVVELMRKERLVPEVRTFSVVMNGWVKFRRFDKVLGVFDGMERNGVRPDVYVCNAMVRSLCELNNFGRAREMVHWMESNLDSFNIVTYNVLIHGLCKNQRVQEAIEVKNELRVRGLKAVWSLGLKVYRYQYA